MSTRYDTVEFEDESTADDTARSRRAEPGPSPDLSNETIEQLLRIDFDDGSATEAPDTSGTGERRASVERPRGTQSKSSFYRMLNAVVLIVESGIRGAAAVFVVFLLSIALLAYSLFYRTATVDSQAEAMREVEILTAEVISLRRLSAERRLQELMTSLSEAESRVFSDYRQLSDWLAERFTHAQTLGLSFEYRIGDSQELSVNRTSEVPITLSIRTGSELTNDTYARSLQMLKELAESRWFVEIIGVHVRGNQDGATSLDADIRVWVHNDEVAHEALAQ